jgi:hypothetical protein
MHANKIILKSKRQDSVSAVAMLPSQEAGFFSPGTQLTLSFLPEVSSLGYPHSIGVSQLWRLPFMTREFSGTGVFCALGMQPHFLSSESLQSHQCIPG